MQLRRQTTSVEKVVVKIRHSLVEPTLRFQQSFSEPLSTTRNLRMAGGYEPGLAMQTPATPATATVHRPAVVQAPLGPIGTARRIIEREGFMALYKGLTAVYAGSILKFSVRFVSFEQYRDWLRAATNHNPAHTTAVTFTAGLASGLTEAILVVTPSEVCKIRMQSQYHSLMDPTQLAHRKYRNVFQTAGLVVREEGFSALYKGLVPTMLRQGLNQAVNFTAYNAAKSWLLAWQNTKELAPWQALVLGGISGGMGPLVNNPLDVVKTRLQKQVVLPGKTPKYTGLIQACALIAKEEGVLALWKGITPRLLRIMPGQAITFMTYEAVSKQLARHVF
jgi:solute carrier family 25 (mitochondrial citrate transporter), member 1